MPAMQVCLGRLIMRNVIYVRCHVWSHLYLSVPRDYQNRILSPPRAICMQVRVPFASNTGFIYSLHSPAFIQFHRTKHRSAVVQAS